MSRPTTLGSNLMIASFLALLSYIPFVYVSKLTLLILAYLFIFDPFPPSSRVVALLSLVVVNLLTRAHNYHLRAVSDDEGVVTIEEVNEFGNKSVKKSSDLEHSSKAKET